MASFTDGNVELHYDFEGPDDGYPVLLIALGGMASSNDAWQRSPWNPRTALSDTYRVIGMDQRNAQLVPDWKTGDPLDNFQHTVRSFLAEHSS